VASD